jgi:hypothetical protein
MRKNPNFFAARAIVLVVAQLAAPAQEEIRT